jgi:hypothetical protein
VREALAEVVMLHDAFTAWLGAGTGEFAAIDAALAPGFAMVPPDGRMLERDDVIGFLRAGRGRRGAAFRIGIEGAAVIHAQADMALVRYIERQWSPDSARRSVALLRWQDRAWRWLWVQETWLAPPDGQAAPRMG